MPDFKLGQEVDFIREEWQQQWIYGRKENCHVGYELASGRVLATDAETVAIVPEDRKKVVFVSWGQVFAKGEDGYTTDEAKEALRMIGLAKFPEDKWRY